MPDTAQNEERFGRPASKGDDQAAFPQARVVGLVECDTHAVFDAEIGSYATSETKLAPACFGSLEAGMLALADRGFWSLQRCSPSCPTARICRRSPHPQTARGSIR